MRGSPELSMGKLILIVDDEADIRDLYCDELSDEGYKVICAADGAEAIKIAEKELIDLVVTDVKMPEGSGQTVALWFNTFKSKIPVVVVTAFPHYEDILMGEIKYAQAFFTKPVIMKDLKKKISELLVGQH
jgi:two-component system OmpR family response regulator